MSASDKGKRGGVPSTTQPIAGPWLSPKVVKRNRWPKVLADMEGLPGPSGRYSLDRCDVGRIHRLHADDVVAAVDVVGFAGHTGR